MAAKLGKTSTFLIFKKKKKRGKKKPWWIQTELCKCIAEVGFRELGDMQKAASFSLTLY